MSDQLPPNASPSHVDLPENFSLAPASGLPGGLTGEGNVPGAVPPQPKPSTGKGKSGKGAAGDGLSGSVSGSIFGPPSWS